MHVGFYTAKQVAELTTFSRTSIWRGVREGWFPKPVKLSPGRNAWPRQTIHEWLERIAGENSNAA